MNFTGYAYSLIGNREMNQDAYLVENHRGLFAVADGVGGGMGGEIASKMAVEGLSRDFSAPSDLKKVFSSLQTQILKEAMNAYGEPIMGTTLTAVAIEGEKGTICHVGDSRCYLYRDSHLKQVTEDQEFYDESIQGTVLGSYLGIPSETHPLQIRQEEITLAPKNRLLMCSDGLYRQMNETRMAHLIRDLQTMPEGLVRTLCEEAAQKAYSDNVTVVYIEIE